MRRIAPDPGGAGRRDGRAEKPVGAKDSPEVGELREEESRVTLPTDVLQYLVRVNLVERPVGERQRQVVEVPDDVRPDGRVRVEGRQPVPVGSTRDVNESLPAMTAAEEESVRPHV